MRRMTFACDDGHGLYAQLSEHFGRCPYYTLVDIELNEVKEVSVIANPYFNNHIPGQVPLFIKDQKTRVMIAGDIGAQAISLFRSFGIEVYTGLSGQVKDVLQNYFRSKAKEKIA